MLVLPICENDDVDASGAGALQQLVTDCALLPFPDVGSTFLILLFAKPGC